MRKTNLDASCRQLLQVKLRRSSLPVILTLALAAMFTAQAAQAQTYTVLFKYNGGPVGEAPNGDLLLDAEGNLYGTTRFGGANGDGTIFKLDPSGMETALFSFSETSGGVFPMAGVIRDPDGTFYGVTAFGGDFSCENSGCGAVFKVDSNNVLTVLHTFDNLDGANPQSRLVSVNGELYGTTLYGGGTSCTVDNPGCGVIFKVSKNGAFSVVYRFTGGLDGFNPNGLTRDAAGNLYGTSQGSLDAQGQGNLGTVFKLDTAGNFSILYSFEDNSNGFDPQGRLAIDNAGVIHGTTFANASTCNGGCGVVYRLDQSGNETVVHHFGGVNGHTPEAGVVDLNGAFYGTTVGGGIKNGVLYQITNAGHYNVLHEFTRAEEQPQGELTVGSDGNIYGATFDGAIFKLTP
jgi:uncharacterized repeat protein (TIGR03803 family)